MINPEFSYAACCRDPRFFGPWFAADSWATWGVLDKAIFGDPLSPDELALFQELTGRDEAPAAPVAEAWIIAGRRSGKDVKAASIVAYLATIGAAFLNPQKHLAPGERGVIQLLAVDRSQALICLGYLKAMFEQPALATQVAKDLPDGLDLINGLSIEITTNDKRRVRGRTVIAAVLDEVAFWMSDERGSVNPDTAVYDALTPAMATIPGAMLIGISSPYAKRGLLWQKFRKHYSKPAAPDQPDILVIKAPTWRMNPTLSRASGKIAAAYIDDPIAASAEYGAEFRSDVSGFIEHDAIDAITAKGCISNPPNFALSYHAFIDPSGGSKDAMTLGIAHNHNGTAILDCLSEIKPPFHPMEAVKQFCALLKSYGISRATGDRYGAEWVSSAFHDNGIDYQPSSRSRSEIYLELLPAINSGSCRLLDNHKLAAQLTSLERKTSRTGRDTVDHAPGAHDDLANAAAGALVEAGANQADPSGGIMRLGYGPGGFRLISAPAAPPKPLSEAEEEAAFLKRWGDFLLPDDQEEPTNELA